MDATGRVSKRQTSIAFFCKSLTATQCSRVVFVDPPSQSPRQVTGSEHINANDSFMLMVRKTLNAATLCRLSCCAYPRGSRDGMYAGDVR